MAADGRLTRHPLSEVVAFVEAFLDADAALSRAAVSEPDDDRYLAVERQAASFLAAPLTPLEGRWAVPGGTSPQATVEVGDSIAAAPLYAVLRVGERDWVAVTGTKRDRAGTTLGDALRIGVVDGDLKVVGRAQWDPFAPGVEWAAAGGVDVPLDDPVLEATLLRAPARPEHARWVAGRAR